MPSENDLLLLRSRRFQKANCPDRYGHRRDLDPAVRSVDTPRSPPRVCHIFPGTRHSHSALAATSAPDERPSHIRQPLRPCGRAGPKDRRSRNDIQRSSGRSVMPCSKCFCASSSSALCRQQRAEVDMSLCRTGIQTYRLGEFLRCFIDSPGVLQFGGVINMGARARWKVRNDRRQTIELTLERCASRQTRASQEESRK